MSKFNLPALAARKRNSRRPIALAMIRTTKAQADDLARIYLEAIAPWSRAAEMLAEPYQRALAQLQTDSPAETAATTDAIAAAINRLVLELTPDLRRWAFRVERWHRNKWVNAVLSAVDVELETLLGAEDERETIDLFLVRNTSLIRDINEEARGRIADSVFRGFQRRATADEVAKEIREAASMARTRARRIAGDQTVKLASALDRERQRQAGLDHWKWRHSGKLHPRPEHVARDGKIYTDKTAPEDEPGELPYCGCVRQGVLVFADA